MHVNGYVTGTVYHIAKGDTLSEIAQHFGRTVEELVAANKIANRDLIYAGATLKLGSGTASGTAASNVAGTGQFGGGASAWMNIAYKYVGQHEYAKGDNPFIEACLASTTYGAACDETPWCSAFVNYVMEKAGYKGTNSALADSWAHWGANVGSLANARTGDIVVIHDSAGHQHVGFLVRAGNGTITLLGGNQSNQVKESTFSLSSWHIYAIRRPANSV
jgi:uncharacterized protein (TIGR02594 family)